MCVGVYVVVVSNLTLFPVATPCGARCTRSPRTFRGSVLSSTAFVSVSCRMCCATYCRSLWCSLHPHTRCVGLLGHCCYGIRVAVLCHTLCGYPDVGTVLRTDVSGCSSCCRWCAAPDFMCDMLSQIKVRCTFSSLAMCCTSRRMLPSMSVIVVTADRLLERVGKQLFETHSAR